jgi:uncharacterized membrane protein YkvA (DUF1232 family)
MKTNKLLKSMRKQFSGNRMMKLVGGKKKFEKSVTKFLKAVNKRKGVIGTVAAGLGTTGIAVNAEDWLTGFKDDGQDLLSLVRDWSSGEYSDVDRKTLLIVAGAIAYFVSPVDLVPDWLPGLDQLDDIAVLLIAIHAVRQEVERYREWKQPGTSAPRRRRAETQELAAA